MSHPGAGPPADPNDDDGCDPRRGPPDLEAERVDPLVRLGLAPEPEPEGPQKGFMDHITGLADDAKGLVSDTLDQAGDMLRTEGVIGGASSKLEKARRHQEELERRHSSIKTMEKVAYEEAAVEREEAMERYLQQAAAIKETLLPEKKQPKMKKSPSPEAEADAPADLGEEEEEEEEAQGLWAKFSAPKIQLQDSSHVPASHAAADGSHVGMTEGHHPHRAQKTLHERQHTDHVLALLQAAEGAAPTKLSKVLHKLQPSLIVLVAFIDSIGPRLEAAGVWLYLAQAQEIYRKMPTSALRALYGLALCFFGGIFSNTIAAYAAFQQTGWDKTKTCIHDLRKAAEELYLANLEEDARDDDDDGIADVRQLDGRMILSRKIELVMRTVDPTVLQQAGVGLYHGLLGVLSSLKFKLARSISLGLSVGNMLKRPLAVFLAPTLQHIMSQEECKKWSPLIINYSGKTIAVLVALALQSRISAIQSGVMGGHIFATAILQLAREFKIVTILPEDTYVDEVIGWSLAVIGIWSQLASGMRLQFPLNVSTPQRNSEACCPGRPLTYSLVLSDTAGAALIARERIEMGDRCGARSHWPLGLAVRYSHSSCHVLS